MGQGWGGERHWSSAGAAFNGKYFQEHSGAAGPWTSGCGGREGWVSCFAAQSSPEPLQLLVTAGITETVLLEDGSDTDPASGGEDGVSLHLTGTSHGETTTLLASCSPFTTPTSFPDRGCPLPTRPAGQDVDDLQLCCKNKPED